MGSVTKIFLILLLVAAGHTAARDARAGEEGQPLGPRLVGHWSLASFEVASGNLTEYPFGRDAIGQIIYDSAGHMAVQIMKAARPPFASGDQAVGTAEEVSAALQGYVAYYGTYTVDERA